MFRKSRLLSSPRWLTLSISSRNDKCNCILLHLALNAATRLIACLLFYSHASAPSRLNNYTDFLFLCIKFKLLTLVFKTQLGLRPNWVLDPKYLGNEILRPLSASSHRPLHSSNILDLLVPNTMGHQQWLLCLTWSLYWNARSPSTCSKILASNLSSSFAFLKTYFFSHGLVHFEAHRNGSRY